MPEQALDGIPLDSGWVSEDKPTEFSCTCTCIHMLHVHAMGIGMVKQNFRVHICVHATCHIT